MIMGYENTESFKEVGRSEIEEFSEIQDAKAAKKVFRILKPFRMTRNVLELLFPLKVDDERKARE